MSEQRLNNVIKKKLSDVWLPILNIQKQLPEPPEPEPPQRPQRLTFAFESVRASQSPSLIRGRTHNRLKVLLAVPGADL